MGPEMKESLNGLEQSKSPGLLYFDAGVISKDEIL